MKVKKTFTLLITMIFFSSCTAMRGIKPLPAMQNLSSTPQELYVTTDGILCENLPKIGMDQGNPVINDAISGYIEQLKKSGRFTKIHHVEPEDLPKEGRYISVSFKCPLHITKVSYFTAFLGVLTLLLVPIQANEYFVEVKVRGYENGKLLFTKLHKENFISYLGHITNYLFGDSRSTASEKISSNIAALVANVATEGRIDTKK